MLEEERSHSYPKISVIVPIYNVEAYIRQCATSLFSQTWQNLQFIFVDDGSSDHSVDILEDVLRSYPERSVQTTIIRQPNRGLPVARMAGLSQAVGEYIIHVDSDDWVEPDYARVLIEKAIEENADVVYCDFFKEYENKPSKIEREKDFYPDNGATATKAMHNSIIRAYMWNKLIKKDLYDLENMIVPIYGYHEDIVFQTQILYNAKKCYHLKEPLYHYRRRRKGALTAAPLITSRRHSAANMLHLYDSLPSRSGPITTCGIDILLRAGWYSCIIMDFKLLAKYPKAVDILSKMSYIHSCRVPVWKQRYTKFCCSVLIKWISLSRLLSGRNHERRQLKR